jgi:hypothetical protein
MDFIIRFARQSPPPFYSQPVFVGFGAGFDSVEIAALEIQAQHPNKSPERNARWRWLVARKDRGLFHIVGRPWLSFFR